MVDTNLIIVMVIVAVAAVCIYGVERYTRNKSIDWPDAAKIGAISGAGAGGLVFALGGSSEVLDLATAAASSAASAASTAAGDMFVGKPSF
uniref:Uncharacterized protein n=1 Tax=viral metagenome TaxID=1070528 RepID=A0A6C0K5T9_9ZZZZ